MQEIKKKEGEWKGSRGFAIFSIVVFMTVLVLPTAVWLVMGMIWPKGREGVNFQMDENRNMAPFPETFGPAYGEELEAYYNDRLPFRSAMILAQRNLTLWMEKPYDDLIGPCLVKLFYDDFGRTESGKKADTPNEESSIRTDPSSGLSKGGQTTGSNEYDEDKYRDGSEEVNEPLEGYFPPKVHNKSTIEGREKWLFFALENSLEDYLGNNILSEEELKTYLDGMEELERICQEKGKKLYFFLPPNKEQVYAEFMPTYKTADTYKRVQRLVDYVHANSDIKIIYPIEELKAAKEKWQLYFKTDTHWNDAGAFIGTQALYALMEVPVTDLSELTAEERAFESGDLVRVGNLNGKDYEGDISYMIYYKLYVDVSFEEGEHFSSDICSTVSTAENQSSIVVVGDSFRISMGQFLSKDFGRCMLLNSFNMEEAVAVEAIQNADIIVIESLERMNVNLPGLMTSVGNILER